MASLQLMTRVVAYSPSRLFTSSVSLDAVIIGASSIKHLEDNIMSTKHGPLHEGVFDFSY